MKSARDRWTRRGTATVLVMALGFGLSCADPPTEVKTGAAGSVVGSLVGGLVGCIGGYALQYWAAAVAYPVNIGGPAPGIRAMVSSTSNDEPSARRAVSSMRLPMTEPSPVAT